MQSSCSCCQPQLECSPPPPHPPLQAAHRLSFFVQRSVLNAKQLVGGSSGVPAVLQALQESAGELMAYSEGLLYGSTILGLEGALSAG